MVGLNAGTGMPVAMEITLSCSSIAPRSERRATLRNASMKLASPRSAGWASAAGALTGSASWGGDRPRHRCEPERDEEDDH